MEDKKVTTLTDDNGNISSMRVMSAIALAASIAFGALTIIVPNHQAGIYITFGFLLSAFCPKALQKFAETKIGG